MLQGFTSAREVFTKRRREIWAHRRKDIPDKEAIGGLEWSGATCNRGEGGFIRGPVPTANRGGLSALAALPACKQDHQETNALMLGKREKDEEREVKES